MTLFYAPNPFWGPPPRVIGPCCPFCTHPLWDLAMRHATSGVVLRGRGDLPVLVLLGEVICMTPRCPHVLWEPCSPLEWFWCYWGWSRQRRAPICCERVVQPPLNIPAKFQGNWSGQRGHIAVRIGEWGGGKVGACASPLWQSSGLSLRCVGLLALSPR